MLTLLDRVVYPVKEQPLRVASRAVSRQTSEIRDPLRSVRLPPDPFSLLDDSADALRPSEESYSIARSVAQSTGSAPIDEGLLGALAVVPANNMATFKRRGGAICFADTFLAAAESDEAHQRRGRPLDAKTRREYASLDRAGSQVFGIYDQTLDTLVFTGRARPLNHERVVLHEFGHAMTVPEWYRVAHLRSDLLMDLPPQMQDLLKAYPQDDSAAAIRERVLEVLADAYVWTLVGRWAELPSRVFSILQPIVAGEEPA